MSTTTENHQFPKFYRKHGRCIKVISATEIRTIILPPERTVPERFTSQFPNTERLTEELEGFELTDAATWRSFFFTFAQAVQAEREAANKDAIVDK